MTQLFIYLETSWFLFHFWGIILVNIELLFDIYIFSAFEYIGLLPSGLKSNLKIHWQGTYLVTQW